MKVKDIKELHNKTREELAQMAGQKFNEARMLRAELSVGRSKNLRAAKAIRQDLARVKTILREKQEL